MPYFFAFRVRQLTRLVSDIKNAILRQLFCNAAFKNHYCLYEGTTVTILPVKLPSRLSTGKQMSSPASK